MGRADLCAPSGVVLGGVEPATETEKRKIDRSQPIVAVTLNGERAEPTTYTRFLQSIMVEETTGFLMNVARVVFVNPEGGLTDDKFLEEQVEMIVEMGFEGVGLERIGGKFLVETPKFVFAGANRIELIGYGEEIKLGATEKRRKFEKRRDDQIASQIAEENGFEADVETTDLVHDLVLQANENDYKFLAKRAKLYGFMLYVENGVLHFHQPRPREKNIQLLYKIDGPNMLKNVTVETRPPLLRGAVFEATQIDPLDLELVTEQSQEKSDPVTQAILGSVRDPKKWDKIAAVAGQQARRFLVNEGHEQVRAQLKEQVEAFSQSTRWVIKAHGVVPGVVGLHANDLVELLGVGRHSGKYVVTKAVHRFADKGYEVAFELMRTFSGMTTGSLNEAQEVSPVSAGVVTLG